MLENSYNVDILRLGEVWDFDHFEHIVSDYSENFDKVTDLAEQEMASAV